MLAIRQARIMKARKLAFSSTFSEVRASTSSQTTASPARPWAARSASSAATEICESISSSEIEPLQRDVELAQVADDHAGVLAGDVAEDHVALRLLRRPRQEDEVRDRGGRLQQVEDVIAVVAGGDDPQVDHCGPGYPRGTPVGSRACSPTTTCTCVRTRTTPRRSATSPRPTSIATWRRPRPPGSGRSAARSTSTASPTRSRSVGEPPLVAALGHRRPRRLLRVRRRLAAAAGDRVRLRPRGRGPHRLAARGAPLRLRGRLGPLHRRPRPGHRGVRRLGGAKGTRTRSGAATSRRSRRAPAADCSTSSPTPTWSSTGGTPGRGRGATRASTTSQAVEAIAESGIAVEVSTAGLRKPVAEIYPAPAFAEMCVEAGAVFALSSDAHTPGGGRLRLRAGRRLPRGAGGGGDLGLRGPRAAARAARPGERGGGQVSPVGVGYDSHRFAEGRPLLPRRGRDRPPARAWPGTPTPTSSCTP